MTMVNPDAGACSQEDNGSGSSLGGIGGLGRKGETRHPDAIIRHGGKLHHYSVARYISSLVGNSVGDDRLVNSCADYLNINGWAKRICPSRGSRGHRDRITIMC